MRYCDVIFVAFELSMDVIMQMSSLIVASCGTRGDALLATLNDCGEFDMTPLPCLKYDNPDRLSCVFTWNGDMYVLFLTEHAIDFEIYKIISPNMVLRMCMYSGVTRKLDTTQVQCNVIHIDTISHVFAIERDRAYIGTRNTIVCVDLPTMSLVSVVVIGAGVSSIYVFEGIVYYTMYVHAIRPEPQPGYTLISYDAPCKATYCRIGCNASCYIYSCSDRQLHICFDNYPSYSDSIQRTCSIDVPDAYASVIHIGEVTTVKCADVSMLPTGRGGLWYKNINNDEADVYEIELLNDIDGARYRLNVPIPCRWAIRCSIIHA